MPRSWASMDDFESFLDDGGLVEADDVMPDAYRQAVFAFIEMHANSELMGGLTERDWIPKTPGLRHKMAVLAKTQDEIGHGHLLYMVAADLGVKTRAQMLEDLFAGRSRFHNVFHYRAVTWGDQVAIAFLVAFGRPSGDYRCCHLVEFTTRDWTEALVRHWIYDTFETMRWQLVSGSSLPKLASIASKALQEESFHRRHADALLDTLLASPEARQRVLKALSAVGPLVNGLCEPVEGEAEAITSGVAAGSIADLLPPLHQVTEERFGTASSLSFAVEHGQNRRRERSADFEPLLARMREVLDYDPEAIW